MEHAKTPLVISDDPLPQWAKNFISIENKALYHSPNLIYCAAKWEIDIL